MALSCIRRCSKRECPKHIRTSEREVCTRLLHPAEMENMGVYSIVLLIGALIETVLSRMKACEAFSMKRIP
jgi:hypothetical protein